MPCAAPASWPPSKVSSPASPAAPSCTWRCESPPASTAATSSCWSPTAAGSTCPPAPTAPTPTPPKPASAASSGPDGLVDPTPVSDHIAGAENRSASGWLRCIVPEHVGLTCVYARWRRLVTGDLALTIGRQEADNIEFKSAVVDRDKICKAICVLANDLPGRGEGYLVIGVADNGTSLGLAVTDDVLLAVRNFRNDGRLLPRPTFHVERAEYAGLPCVLVTVPAAISPPVSFDGRVFVPVGPSTQVATPDEERVLRERRQAADLPFDQQPVPGSTDVMTSPMLQPGSIGSPIVWRSPVPAARSDRSQHKISIAAMTTEIPHSPPP